MRAAGDGPGAKRPSRWRGRLLYVLALPLLPAGLIALAQGEIVYALAILGGFALVAAGAARIRHDLLVEDGSIVEGPGRGTDVPHRRATGAALAAAGTFLVVWLGPAVGKGELVAGLLYGIMVLAGCRLRYGFEDAPRPEAPAPVASDGRTDELSALLDEAADRIGAIERASRDIRNDEFRDRLGEIVAGARGVLEAIERNPAGARRARKFLKVYLDGTRQVTEGYARTHRDEACPVLEDNFRRVLGTIETVIEEQQRKLRENDATDLEVKIAVLQMQMEREGVT